MLTAATCFSGICAPELGGPQFDWRWHAEIEKSPSAIASARFPHSANLGDVTEEDFIRRATALGALDLLVGGPPCQAFSFAGLRRSMTDARGNLSLRFVEIARELKPRSLLVENVPGWLSTPDNAFGCFLGAIIGGDGPLFPCGRPAIGRSNTYWKWKPARKDPVLDEEGDETGEFIDRPAEHVCKWPDIGMVAGPLGRAAWRIFDAQYFGLAQRRRRVFVVVDFGNGADPARVLFESRSMRGDHPPSRETGAAVAGTLDARSSGGGFPGSDGAFDGHIVHASAVARALTATATATGRLDPNGQEFIAHLPDVAHTLRGEGYDATEDGSGRTTLVPETVGTLNSAGGNAVPGNTVQDAMAGQLIPSVAGALLAGAFTGGASGRPDGMMAGHFIPVAFDTTQITHPENRSNPQPDAPSHSLPASGHAPAIAFSSKDFGADASDDLSPTVRAGNANGGNANGGAPPAIAFVANDYSTGAYAEAEAEAAGSLTTNTDPTRGAPLLASSYAVRRLTPVECERLQGFPDNFTLIDSGKWRTISPEMGDYLRRHGADVVTWNDGRLRTRAMADGPRYKGLGNSWARNVGAWILARLAEELRNAE